MVVSSSRVNAKWFTLADAWKVSANGNTGSGQDQAGDDDHRSEGLQRVLLPERRRSALLALIRRRGLVPPWVDLRPRGWRCARPAGAMGRLYGARVEAG